MSEQELSMSEEDKFFGVRTKIGGTQEEEENLSAETVEEEDDSSDLGEEELKGYSKRVQKRINKLRYESHEERRKTESAEKMRGRKEQRVRIFNWEGRRSLNKPSQRTCRAISQSSKRTVQKSLRGRRH